MSDILDYAPEAEWVVIYETDNYMLHPIRRVVSGDIFQFGNVGNPLRLDVIGDMNTDAGFPKFYSTAGGTYMRRSALQKLLRQLPVMRALYEKYADDQGLSCSDICIYIAAGIAKLKLAGSLDVMESTKSCNAPSGLLYPCYRCVHRCKLRGGCYEQTSYNPLRWIFRGFLENVSSNFFHHVVDVFPFWVCHITN